MELGLPCQYRAIADEVVVWFSHVRLFTVPLTAAFQASLSFTISQSLLNLMYTESVMPSNHFILCRPLLLPTSIFSSIRVFSNDSTLCIRWPKYRGFSFNISLSNEYSRLNPSGLTGLISFCPRDSQESSPVQQFKSTQPSLWSSSHIHTRLHEKSQAFLFFIDM